MNAIHRLALTLRAQFEDFVDQVENHEAVAEAALNQFRANVVDAKFRLRCLEKEITRAEERTGDLARESAQWKSRALESEAKDRDRALECVKRMRAADLEKTHLETQISEMRRVHDDVQRDVRRVESQYEDLRRQHKILVSRQSRTEALRAVRATAPEAPAVFERWQAKVEKSEIHNEVLAVTESLDSFAEEYRHEEDRRALEELLADLHSDNQGRSRPQE